MIDDIKKYEKRLLAQIMAQERAISAIFEDFTSAVAPLLRRYREGGKGVWVRNKDIESALNSELRRLENSLTRYLNSQTTAAWGLSHDKTDIIVKDYIKGLALSETAREGLFFRNMDVLKAFQNRVEKGFSVSERIWKTTREMKTQMELYLQSGLATGRSAAQISRDVRGFLQDPDKQFRRVRDPETGKLKPSKPMKNYHPGTGKYRSAYKNAVRLTRTETNMAYRFSDQVRWRQTDFITGYEVVLSAAHPEYDICFTSWNVKVSTSEGPKNIVDVKADDLVLTHAGKYQRVKKVFRSTVYKVDKTEISYKVNYDSRGKKRLVSATDNHPFLVNGEWLPISKIVPGDMVKVLAVRCKQCNKLIPEGREYCSKSCASLTTATNQWKNETHRNGVSEKRKKLIKENNGKIPWLSEYVASGKNVDNLSRPDVRKKSLDTRRKNIAILVAKGEHHFQNPEIHKKALQALGKYHNSTFIEKKMEWLLTEKNINFKKGVALEREVLNKFGRPRIFKPDFILPEYNIVIECDGEYWHQDAEKDLKRQREIEQMGYRVLRFAEKRIRNDLKSCSQEIDRVLKNHNGEYEFMDVEINHVRHYTQSQKTPITKYNLEVETDNSYIANGFVVHNCDSMIGQYPKNFVFSGWHPNCYCFTVPVMLKQDQFAQYINSGRIPSGEKVKGIPPRAFNYVKGRSEKLAATTNKPYWLKDNFTKKNGTYFPKKVIDNPPTIKGAVGKNM